MYSKLKHHPVMVDEVLSYLAQISLKHTLIVHLDKAGIVEKY